MNINIVVPHGDVNRALKDLRRGLQKAGTSSEVRRRRYYEKPSIISSKKKKERKRQAIKNQNKRQFKR